MSHTNGWIHVAFDVLVPVDTVDSMARVRDIIHTLCYVTTPCNRKAKNG